MFRHIELHDPSPYADRRLPTIAWWSTENFDQRRYRAQELLLRLPGRVGYAACDICCDGDVLAGMQVTVEELWLLAEHPERQRQLLRAALLFEWVDSSRRCGGYSPDSQWPNFKALETLYRDALDIALPGQRAPWMHYHSSVVPGLPWDPEHRFTPYGKRDLRKPAAFALALEAQVDRLLAHWQPVVVGYTAPADDAYVAYVQRTEAEQAAAQRAAWAEREAAQAAQRAAELAKKRLKHPRYGEWDSLSASKEALQQLIRTTPRTRITTEFGVPVSAIQRMCVRHGLALPPVGYWSRKAQQPVAAA